MTRRAALVGSLFSLAACGGSGSDTPPPDVPPPPPPAPPVVPVNGPAWLGFARDAQHSALGAIATQALRTIWWSTPVDLAPPYGGGGSLLAHYGTPAITRHNTVVVPVKLDAAGRFRVDAFIGINGQRLWTLDTDYRLQPHNWVPSLNPTLAPDGRLFVPAAGGRIIERAGADVAASSERTLAFYGNAAYDSATATFDATVFVNTPLTSDSQGNVFFGFTVTGANPLALAGGIARLGADGSRRWVSAAIAAGDMTMAKAATNSAPALSNDERTLYVVVNEAPAGQRAAGRLLALDAQTLATQASALLVDPLSGTPAWVSENATSSPTVGPDGDVFIGVLEASAPAHSFRGWLLHFDAALAQARTPGGFGWDSTASIVPRAMVPQYAGTSSYLLALKYNSYAGIGLGDGQHRVAVVDPHGAQLDRFSSAAVMREVLTVLGPTPDPYTAGGRKEWCINTAAVDPLTSSVLMNSEDGSLYRWHLPSNALAERIGLNNGYAQSYTPTAIGADGRVYAVNNARLFSIGA
ncbi:MAG: hypothetical protein HZC37_07365 [Burkholderiales bacterium]|nr:hypothetical protein [Burkholderiales bacterium]